MGLSSDKPTKARRQGKRLCSPIVQPDTLPQDDASPEQIARYGLDYIGPAGTIWTAETGPIRTVYAVPHACPEAGLVFVGGCICGHWRGAEAALPGPARATLGTLLDAMHAPKRAELDATARPDWPWPSAPWEWNPAAERGESC